MINLAHSEEEKKDMKDSMAVEAPRYPYGLEIDLDPATVKKLGLSDVPKVGEKFMVLAIAEVSAVRKDRGVQDDSVGFSVSLQVTDMDIKKEEQKEKKDSASVLYGGAK